MGRISGKGDAVKSGMLAKLDAMADAAFEAGWEEFIKSGDELGWDRRLILEGSMKAAVMTAMRTAWQMQF